MNQEQFIELLKDSLIKGSVNSNILLFKNPPGKLPDKLLLEIASFYKGLSEVEKETFRKCLIFQSMSTTFNLLTMIDGVNRFSEDVNARFELYIIENDEKYLLNDPNNDFLHDLLKNET